MDVSVSRLNGRLASKLPPELPLGLVFVVGNIVEKDEDGFVLAEETHQLHCRLAENMQAQVGDEIRAGGHLMFDPEKLQYYLLARDVEVISVEPASSLVGDSRELLAENEGLLSALAAVKARATAAPAEDEETLPIWVQKLAPPEVIPPVEQSEGSSAVVQQTAELDEELVTMLSAAMDSDEEMELTPELLAPYLPEPPEPDEIVKSEPMVEETADSLADLSTSYRPTNRQDTDWLVILLIITFFILTIAAISAIILLN